MLAGISKLSIKNENLPIGIIPLYACSAAAVKVLSLTYLSFIKNIWFDLFERAIAGFPITPFIFIYSYSYSIGIISSAVSFPKILYTTDFISPLPFVEIVVFPVFISLNEISGCTKAALVITSSIYPVSVKSFFKNLYLTGVL